MQSPQTFSSKAAVPRSEFPRPEWEREQWLTLNGEWDFALNPSMNGNEQPWKNGEPGQFPLSITVPFSWVHHLSGIARDEKGVGWYRRSVRWSHEDQQDRIFLCFGAVDYHCEVWLNGFFAGRHQGGYSCFEFEVSEWWNRSGDNTVVVRVEDHDHSSQTRGKQGYSEIRGIWQPVWLEARPVNFIKKARFITALDGRIQVLAELDVQQAGQAVLEASFDKGAIQHQQEIPMTSGIHQVELTIQVNEPQLWSPEHPFLYEGELYLKTISSEAAEFAVPGRTMFTDQTAPAIDKVRTYFGIREIGTTLHEGRDYRWITLNGKPIYLNGALDQSFHPTGHFTYPSDDEMKNEIFLMKRLGLNMVRIHIKPEEPRKLYWADKLGILVMEDMPCFWGNPDEGARAAYCQEAEEIINRDFNHPSIFSWVMFNETWGLKTNDAPQQVRDWAPASTYLPETQNWVKEVYHWAKKLDPTRLVEDNSPCNFDHVESDINTWHFYINGYEKVRDHIQEVVGKTFEGSSFNYCGGRVQSDAPLMNSECGNVWGIEGGAGDSDLAWHYRYMMNEFRKHDKLCGFVFTEFRDVVNEFNGYYRLNGMDKRFGYEDFVPGMTIADLHALDFIIIDAPPCQTLPAACEVEVPLLRSSYSDRYFGQTLYLEWELWHDNFGVRTVSAHGSIPLVWEGYGVSALDSLKLRMPEQEAVAVLAVRLQTGEGKTITRNFTSFDVRALTSTAAASQGERRICIHGNDYLVTQVPVSGYREHTFPHQWNALAGYKTCGGPEGSFSYEIDLPSQEELPVIGEIELWFEASAKRLLQRNVENSDYQKSEISFMHGAKANTELNPNTYYMTDDDQHKSNVQVRADGETIGTLYLPDNPADSRGVLSWHYQAVANKLEEAGSYGYLCRLAVPSRILARLNETRRLQLVLQSDEGGLALYGRNAGRYPHDLLVCCR
ncbi:glycoside hydrolase family 2 protein [Paenibacillus senegalensis]|uniref:glycoside hydrolase family 2 protein n=1 Tax=Paenibacillus senegalensis TaxID=1465766 RepID=UPI000288EC3A|nr:glycoside hydrolase family 2 [Paenibacillus senegalensis]